MILPLQTLIRYIKITVTVALLAAFLAVTWFLYQNFYLPLTQSAALAELKTKIALITVNKKELENTLTLMNERRKPILIDWNSMRNVFVPSVAPVVAPNAPAPPTGTIPVKRTTL